MDPKELSPAYYTSLGLILLGAVLAGLGFNALAVIGWVLLIPGIGLNIFATQVMIQKHKGGPLPGVFTDDTPAEPADTAETGTITLNEPEPDTEAQPIITPNTSDEPADEKIFRPRTPRPRVR